MWLKQLGIQVTPMEHGKARQTQTSHPAFGFFCQSGCLGFIDLPSKFYLQKLRRFLHGKTEIKKAHFGYLLPGTERC